jgi:hypothetical protein
VCCGVAVIIEIAWILREIVRDKIRFGCYANVRDLYGMKQCLNCQNDFEYKREAAKFCSDKCRAAYNRAHPEKQVTKLQMQSLYNAVLEAVEKIQYAAPQKEYDSPRLPPTMQDEPLKFAKPVPKVAADAIMRKYVEDRRDCTCEEEFRTWFERLDADERLTSRQKELVKNTN